MQIRRVLLLFALVLGLSAVVASIAPSPETDEEPPSRTTPAAKASPASVPTTPVHVTLRGGTQRVPAGSSFSLDVPVKEPGDVAIDSLGLRQSADPHTPAHFELLASPRGRHSVEFTPVLGERRVIGQLDFAEPETATRRPRDR